MFSSLMRYTLTAALRDRIFLGFILIMLVIASISNFLGSATIVEQLSFSMVYKAGAMRLAGAISLVLFICFYIRRAYDSREIDFMVSRPVSRPMYVLSLAMSFMVIAAILACAIAGILYVSGVPDVAGWQIWSFSLLIEYILISLIAMFFAMVIKSAAGAALACFALYALGRMVGVLAGIADMPTDNQGLVIAGYFFDLISIFVPRFDLMGQTSWLVYGAAAVESDLTTTLKSIGLNWFLYAQGLVFGLLFILASIFDFTRKQF